jgi:hypothetical protein
MLADPEALSLGDEAHGLVSAEYGQLFLSDAL